MAEARRQRLSHPFAFLWTQPANASMNFRKKSLLVAMRVSPLRLFSYYRRSIA